MWRRRGTPAGAGGGGPAAGTGMRLQRPPSPSSCIELMLMPPSTSRAAPRGLGQGNWATCTGKGGGQGCPVLAFWPLWGTARCPRAGDGRTGLGWTSRERVDTQCRPCLCSVLCKQMCGMANSRGSRRASHVVQVEHVTSTGLRPHTAPQGIVQASGHPRWENWVRQAVWGPEP